MPQDQVDHFFGHIDSDHSGLISLEEFLRFFSPPHGQAHAVADAGCSDEWLREEERGKKHRAGLVDVARRSTMSQRL